FIWNLAGEALDGPAEKPSWQPKPSSVESRTSERVERKRKAASFFMAGRIYGIGRSRVSGGPKNRRGRGLESPGPRLSSPNPTTARPSRRAFPARRGPIETTGG